VAGLRAAAVAAAVATTAAILQSCSPRVVEYGLAAEPALMPRLERIAAAEPLPRGWRRAEAGSAPDAVIELSVDDGSGHGCLAGERYLAAAVAIEDRRYSVSPGDAASIGLEPLEGIAPPRRALCVDGKWPGEAGYPFARPLKLSARRLRHRGAAFPRGSPMAAWLERAAAGLAASGERPFRLAAAGDFQAKGQEARLAGSGGVAALLGEGVVERIRSADAAVVNFEGVASTRGSPNPLKRFRFRMLPGSGKSLAEAGFDAALLANNHVLDFGRDAFLDTLGDLESAGLGVLGAGLDAAEASNPAEIPAGRGIVFLGFATFPLESLGFKTADAAAGSSRPGINADEAGTAEAIRSARAAGRAVVVMAHGGAEYLESPSAEVRARYARFADAGAALILGGHPHVLQGIASRGESLIAYSLGNFLFTGLEEPDLSVRSALLEFMLYEGTVRGFRLHPVTVRMDRTEADPDTAGAEARFARLCAAVKGK
jgi:poly-gamma-glutamate capsule biosynthesis protein CapA/YwtB (metallophosphatase superfamily)